MPAFLTLDSVAAATPDGRTLFENLTLAIGAERVGLVGRNGSGKSTLLRIAAGEAAPSAGSVARTGSVGMLVQHWPDDLTVADLLGVADALARLERITAGDGDAADYELADWTIEERVQRALAETGLAALPLDRRVGTLSGGERTRVAIARLLIEAPDLLLLDEPTNNLDADGRAAIADLVAGWRGGLLVASHDRALLDLMDRIVELTPIGVQVFGGGWSDFAETRAAMREQAASELDRAARALRQTEAGVQRQAERNARQDKAGRAFAARRSEPKIVLGGMKERAENTASRQTQLAARLIDEAGDSLAAARERVEVITPLTIAIPPTGLPANRELLAMEAATWMAGDRRLGPWSLDIRGPERVSLTGPNGAGKTSLLRLAMGLAAPATGIVRRAEERIAMLDQHVALLDGAATILDNVRRLNPALTPEAAHAACARFAFRNRDALRIADTLSGGERMRAGLACLLAGEAMPWLLLLDEPTNHLDLESVEVLEAALTGYDGALLVVSHDRRFLDAIGIARDIALAAGAPPRA